LLITAESGRLDENICVLHGSTHTRRRRTTYISRQLRLVVVIHMCSHRHTKLRQLKLTIATHAGTESCYLRLTMAEGEGLGGHVRRNRSFADRFLL